MFAGTGNAGTAATSGSAGWDRGSWLRRSSFAESRDTNRFRRSSKNWKLWRRLSRRLSNGERRRKVDHKGAATFNGVPGILFEPATSSLGRRQQIGNKEHCVSWHLFLAIENTQFSPWALAQFLTEHKRSTTILEALSGFAAPRRRKAPNSRSLCDLSRQRRLDTDSSPEGCRRGLRLESALCVAEDLRVICPT